MKGVISWRNMLNIGDEHPSSDWEERSNGEKRGDDAVTDSCLEAHLSHKQSLDAYQGHHYHDDSEFDRHRE